MVAVVVDASVALASALPDEESPYADKVMASVESNGLRVPGIWPYEIANGLAIALLRKRITSSQEQSFLDELETLSITVENEDALRTIRNNAAIALRFNLIVYDAACLELSLREKLPLATLDKKLRNAASEAGAALFNPE